MNQQYFIVVLAHSLHGRIRRIHVPHTAIWVVLALALLAPLSLFGIVSSYLRMTWKVSNYNSLRQEITSLRSKYQELQRVSNQKNDQLASLQLLATEVSVAYGIKKKLEGPAEIASEGRLIPTFKESLDDYNFLKSSSLSHSYGNFAKKFQVHVEPSLWPVAGRLVSPYGGRSDPFSGEGAFHTGVDMQASMGTPVKAAADGIIRYTENSGRYGKLIVIDHGSRMQTWYAHLSRFDVMPGQEIRRGETLGASGGTGRVTSPHLHYEVRVGGTPVNPYQFLAKSAISQPTQPTEKDLGF